MEQTCNVPSTCSDTMASLVERIQQPGVCGKDLNDGNALAQAALDGFRNYELMKEVGCQKDPDTGAYCYADAAFSSNPSSLYFYYLRKSSVTLCWALS